jgi:hypothetical protein
MANYSGRLMCDGEGRLMADESRIVGSKTVTVYDEDGNAELDDNGTPVTILLPVKKFGANHGKEVAYHEGSFIFLNDGDESHNARHHENFVTMDGTVDESMTDDPSLVNASRDGENSHHFETQPDDPHYDADAPNKTRLKFDSDRIASTITAHTEAYRG